MDELLLLSGNDIPFPEANLIIHQPRLKEIAYMTEQKFWMSSQLLAFDKEKDFNDKDRNDLSNWSNFNIIMSMIENKDLASKEAKKNLLSLLSLLFPLYDLAITDGAIVFQLKGDLVNSDEIFIINSQNFDKFQQIIIKIFRLGNNKKDDFNPRGELAKKIADKIRKGQQRRAQLAPEANKKISILSRYVSILAVGENKTINDLMEYTVYQLMDQLNVFS